ncbi:3,4-dihydroxy-2-butanone-4-phosphate synthase [Rothia kristinae]|uniref:3,4-dihydroxy-2-butanone-4-phosphate synthase n=1 Tax=Rothia kristinae TaxID=37923 RepID=UPI0028831790|nr:3,4-dihydroxy-2-butanone-4-phosphate synthase [Rothia kristinae]
MFTGIIDHLGTVETLERTGDAARLRLRAGDLIRDLPHGGSLAVDGVCLTAVPDPEAGEGVFLADVMGETLQRTTIGRLAPGDAVNLERCLPAGGRFDGHIVQGHVDGTGSVMAITEHPAWTVLRIGIPERLAPQLAEKGSIAVAGVSLTVTRTSPAGTTPAWFEVGLIPATRTATTLGSVRIGDAVNLETDAVAKYLLRSREFERALLGADSAPEDDTPAADAPDRPVASGSAAAPHRAPAAIDPDAAAEPVRLDRVQEALSALRTGGLVVVVDDEDRENEGDLIGAAATLDAAGLGFMIRHTSGVVCAPMSTARADALGLPPMLARNEDPKGTAYTVTCDAAAGITTGISAADRTRTLRVLADPASTPADLTRPGHVLPLRAVDGGVRDRPGHTEAAVELMRLAGLPEVAAIAEVVHEDGSMRRSPDLRAFADEHGLPMISIEQLITHLDAAPTAPPAPEPVLVPTEHGLFAVRAWPGAGGVEHLSATAVHPDGTPRTGPGAPLVRLHSECLTGDVLGSLRCDCGPQLRQGLAMLAARGGTLVYLRGHEGRGIGLGEKLRAYALQDAGLDTVEANLALGHPADARTWEEAAAILRALGLHTGIRLVTNNPAKADGLRAAGIPVRELVPDEIPPQEHSARYLRTKKERMGHLLDLTMTTERTPR